MPKYIVKINSFYHGGVGYTKGQIIETDAPIEEKHPGQVRMLDDKNSPMISLAKRKKKAAAAQKKIIIPVENVFPSMEELMNKE